MIRKHPFLHPVKVPGSLLWIVMEEKDPFGAEQVLLQTQADADSVAPNGYHTLAKAHLSSEPRITSKIAGRFILCNVESSYPFKIY